MQFEILLVNGVSDKKFKIACFSEFCIFQYRDFRWKLRKSQSAKDSRRCDETAERKHGPINQHCFEAGNSQIDLALW